MPQIFGHPLHLVIVASLLGLFLLFFVAMFGGPAIRQRRKLGAALSALRKMEGAGIGAVERFFKADKTLRHLWEEYNDTLHEQRELNAKSLQYEAVARRSTVPAEVFFTTQTLVDTPLKTEFFKHLPGIVTGIGIFGTFAGILTGLQSFRVDSNPDVVRQSLNALLYGVHEAFFVSATAIGLAMLITVAEKLTIAGLYKKVEQLCQLLDGMYQAGAGEEYLSRLVRASEASASEAKQLKQSLVTDLKAILEDLTSKQIAASNAATNSVAERIVQGMTDGLKEPLTNIQNAVNRATGDQSDAVQRLLVDTMTAMTAQIRDLFGSQISGINQMQQQTLEAMTAAVGKLQQVVVEMGTTGQQTTDAMSQKIALAIEAMEGNQSAMNAQVRELLQEVKQQVEQSNGSTHQKLQEVLASMSANVDSTVKSLQSLVDKAGTRDVARANLIDTHTRDAVTAISSEVKSLVDQAAIASKQMADTVAVMRQITVDSATKMNQGADRLYAASDKFAAAGTATTTVLDRAQGLIKQMADTSGSLTGSATVLNSAINDYKTTRDALTKMVADLRSTVDSAKKEASLTADVLARIERSAQALGKAEKQAEEYLQEVSKVLGEAHQQFGSQVITTLDAVNGKFHEHLTRATSSLSAAIDDLEGVFDKLPN